MRPDELYLGDIVEACDELAEFIPGMNEQRFMQDRLVRSAVLQKLIAIGEAAARRSRELTDRHPHVPWSDRVGFRNIVVHAYFTVDWQIVWNAASVDAPLLRELIADILSQEGLND